MICEICKDTSFVSINIHKRMKAGFDRRYNIVDACPHCARTAEIEYQRLLKKLPPQQSESLVSHPPV